MNESVDRLLVERARLDADWPAMLVASVGAHLLAIVGAVALPALWPKEPPLRVFDGGFSVALPRGGGGTPVAPAAPAPAAATKTAPVESAAPPPPRVIKPPTEVPRPNALPLPDARRALKRPVEPAAAARATATALKPPPAAGPAAPGSGSQAVGIGIGPPGPGLPDGTDQGGDWYLAGVQQKIWMVWNQQIKSGFSQPIGVTFTIQSNGQVTDVRVTQPSGASLLDMAAQRAVFNAAPFGPLPKDYGQNPRTIQALFRPVS